MARRANHSQSRTGKAKAAARSTRKPAEPSQTPRRSSFWIVRVLLGHMRLWASLAIGVACFFLLPGGPVVDGVWTALTRALIAWNVALALYLAAAATMMARSTTEDIERHSDAQDEGAVAIMLLTVTAAAASLGAIFLDLVNPEISSQGARPYIIAFGTVVLSWTFIHVVFALHYAYEYYGDGEHAEGLEFPETDKPDYWDFLYFALVIGVALAVSDVLVRNRWIRHVVAVHSVLAFFFNTGVIALAVSLAGRAF